MKPGSALAIYALFWVMSLFLILPFGVRTHEEAGVERIEGQADSAPHAFSLGRAALRATLLSAILFGLFYLNYVYGWISADALDWTR
jgi:predicted secreted protein